MDFDDIYGPDGDQSLTFVETGDDEMLHGATQDSTYDFDHHFSAPTSSQSQGAAVHNGLSTGPESNADLTFQDVDDDVIPMDNLPEHACRYCGIHEPSCVVMCLVCKKWFCNGKRNTSGSHIVMHMVRSQHKEACLHRDSPLGDTVLECYQCAAKNVFILGYIPAKADSVVVILCRQPCAVVAPQKEPNWQGEEWKPLIHERQLLQWLVNFPTEQAQLRARQITTTQAARLEDLWKENPNATVEELDAPGFNREPEHVRLRYEDAFHYHRVFGPLVQAEAEYDKKIKESQTQSVGHVRWEQGLNKKNFAFFTLPMFMEGNMKLMVGDELRLKHRQTIDSQEWVGIGQVIKIPNNHSDEIGLEMRSLPNDKMPTDSRINFTCEVVWNSISFERMRYALRELETNDQCVSQFIFHKLMGHDVDDIIFKIQQPKKLSAPGLPELNHSQMHAVKQVLMRPLSLIQGPPGTGKTVTSATIVYHLVQQTRGQVLVCAPSNIAVDQLAERIHRTGLRVVRLCAKSREGLESTVEYLTLHAQMKTLEGAAELHKLQQLKEEIGELSSTDQKRYLSLKRVSEHQLLSNADVICCTCSSASDMRLKNFKIKCVLVDESTQATEPEVLVPIIRGVRQLVLVGDHCQLGPVILCKQAAKSGLQQSLFERLVLLGNTPIRLQVQYRMHPVLSAFPSNVFYEGSLQNGVTETERQMRGIDWEWPVADKPMIFWHSSGVEEMSSSGTSYLNRVEAANVEKLTTKLIKAGMEPEQIGIITPYEGQRSFIVSHMRTHGVLNVKLYENLEIANVDAFQGREKDFIIMTCVRSNSQNEIGFLIDPRRLNVALTRAKYGLIIIGNAKVLARQPLWHDLLTTFKQKDLIVEGPISNLKSAYLTLPPPTKKAVANPAFPAARYGTQRQTYTMNEYRGMPPSGASGYGMSGAPSTGQYNMPPQSGYRGPMDPAGAITAQTLRQHSSGTPVPFHMFNSAMPPPSVPSISTQAHHRPPPSSRRTAPAWPQTSHGSAKTSVSTTEKIGMWDPNMYSSQASQQQDLTNYDGTLNGAWTQSQSQGGPGRNAFGVSQQHDDYSGKMAFSQDIEKDMNNLLLSQGP